MHASDVRHMQVCRTKPTEKGKYIKIVLALLDSNKPAVVYDCATTLVALSQAPTAIRAAANCFCQLLVNSSDNNVKLIVLDRLRELKELHGDILSALLMDIVRALSAPAFEIRRKILDLAMELITSKNVAEVCALAFWLRTLTPKPEMLLPVRYLSMRTSSHS